MLMESKASAKTGEGISILQSTTDKFMLVLYRSLKEPKSTGYWMDTYQIPSGYQIPDMRDIWNLDILHIWISCGISGYP